MDREQIKRAAEAIRSSGKTREAKIRLLADLSETIERQKRAEARKTKLAAWLKVSPKFVDFLLWNLILMVLIAVFIITVG